MTLPVISLTTGKVNWTAPTTNTDGSPITTGEITGYVVGLRSLTAAGSAVGTYPIQSSPTTASAISDALSAIAANLKPDNYAASVKAQSANGDSDWATEFQFQGVLPRPNAPTGVSVS